MAEYIVVKASLNENLQDFSRYLWRQSVPHRIVREGDHQYLLVGSEEDALQVSQAYRDYLAGTQDLPSITRKDSNAALGFKRQLLSAPVTTVLLVLSICGYLLVAFNPDFSIVQYFTFYKLELPRGAIVPGFPSGEYWRLITPIFLHFSVLHITFNALWLWVLGHRIERIQGSARMIGLVMTMALGSDIAQSSFAAVSVFGGMSGVIYGLLGYGWMWSLLCPRRSVGIQPAVIVFMLVWLVFCIFGGARLLGEGAVANAAHVGGLVMGLILGIGAGLIARLSEKT